MSNSPSTTALATQPKGAPTTFGGKAKLFATCMATGAMIVASGAPAWAVYTEGTADTALQDASANVTQIGGTLDAFEQKLTPVVYALIGIGLTLASVKIGFRLFRRSIGA